jgi:hypothetical protein
MEGYQFHIPYVGKRSKWKTAIAPLMVLPWLLLLLFWSEPDLASSMFTTHSSSLLNDTAETIDNPVDLQKTLQQKLQESQYEITMDSSNVGQEAIGDEIVYLAESIHIHLMEYMDSTMATVCYYVLMTFLLWSCVVWMLLNLHYALSLFMPLVAFLLCCRVYPQWIFTWNQAITHVIVEVLCYFLQLSPVFPDVEARSTIITIPQPTGHLSRFLPLVKWILIIPHALLLLICLPIFLVVTFIGYIVTSLTGRYPDSLFRIAEAYLRLNFRVMSYSHLLVSDQYPSLSFFASSDKPASH